MLCYLVTCALLREGKREKTSISDQSPQAEKGRKETACLIHFTNKEARPGTALREVEIEEPVLERS